MEADPNFTIRKNLTLTAYTSKFETIVLISISLLFIFIGMFLLFNGRSISNITTGLLTVIFFFIGFIEKLKALFFRGVLIKADENGLFIEGHTKDSIGWSELEASHFLNFFIPFAGKFSSGYNLSVSKRSRKLIKRNFVFLYTKRWIWLNSFGTTASQKDINQVLEYYLPHLSKTEHRE